MKPRVFGLILVAAVPLTWVSAKALSRPPPTAWTVYGEDLGTSLSVSGWRIEGDPARPLPQTMRIASSLPVGADLQYDGEGFVFRPRPSASERRLPTFGRGTLKARYVLVWTGEGPVPDTVDVWVLASCHGAEGSPGEGEAKLTDAATGEASPPALGEKPSDSPETGRALRTVALKVEGGRAELRIEGRLETGGSGKWSAFVGSALSARPSSQMAGGPPPT